MIVTLKDITTKITKGTTPTSIGCKFEKSGINFIKSESLVDGKTIDKSKFAFISERTHERLKRSQIEENDILFSMAGMFLGKTGIATAEVVPANTNQAVAIIRVDDTKANYEYVYYYLNQKSVIHTINTTSAQSAQPNINLKQIGKIKINLPDRKKQDQIVSLLSAIDLKISNNVEINDNLYDLVNTLYTKLFKDTDCEMTTVEDYVDCIYSGGTPATSNMAYWNGNLNWLSSGETRNRFVISTEKTITQLGADNSSTKSAQKYDIVIASAGQGFTRGQTSMLLLNTYINQSVIVLHAKKTVLPYLFWNLTNRYDDLRAISDSSSIRGSLTTKMLSKLKIPKVEDSLILKFSEFAWSIIPQIENNLIENKRLTDLRDSLLPKLMSGEIDVSDIRL